MNDDPAASAVSPWDSAIAATKVLFSAVRGLEEAPEEVVRSVLVGQNYGWTTILRLLGNLSPEITLTVVDHVVDLAASDGTAILARGLLGRLPWKEAEANVPPAVTALLGRDDDELTYLRMAELLEHLGLAVALDELVERAARSDNDGVREVAHEYARGRNGL
jgi:hypothetical protein